MKTELTRRLSLKATIRAYLEEHPAEWVSMTDLARVGGVGGFRTRISELRTQDGLTIQHNGRNGLASAYMLLPWTPQGPDAATTRMQKRLF